MHKAQTNSADNAHWRRKILSGQSLMLSPTILWASHERIISDRMFSSSMDVIWRICLKGKALCISKFTFTTTHERQLWGFIDPSSWCFCCLEWAPCALCIIFDGVELKERTRHLKNGEEFELNAAHVYVCAILYERTYLNISMALYRKPTYNIVYNTDKL